MPYFLSKLTFLSHVFADPEIHNLKLATDVTFIRRSILSDNLSFFSGSAQAHTGVFGHREGQLML